MKRLSKIQFSRGLAALAVMVMLLAGFVPKVGATDASSRTGDMTPAPLTAQGATAAAVISALNLPAGSSASFGTSDPAGYAVFNTAASGFPTEGSSYVALSSGYTSSALTPNSSSSTSGALGGLNTSAGQDMVRMRLDIPVPQGANCWAADWKFFSEEFPEFVGTQYNDAFLIETGTSNFTISGSTITAPNNVAFDSNGKLITINTTGALGMTASNAAGTTYDGATTTLTTSAPATGGTTLTLFFSVIDLGDSVYDSTAFIDNFRFATTQAGECTGPVTVPATVKAGPNVSGAEGSPIALIGSVSNQPSGSSTTWSYTPGSDANPTAACSFADDSALSTAITCTDNGTYTATLTLKDGSNTVLGRASTIVTVANVAPTANFAASSPVDEGSTVNLSLTDPSDPSAVDTAAGFSYAFDCGDGNGYSTPGSSNTTTCTALDNPSQAVKGKIIDQDGSSTEYSADVTVNNVAPSTGGITVQPGDLIAVNTTINASANFTDPGTLDTHTAVWDWGDGATSTGTVTEASGSGSIADSHIYTEAGVYTVTLTVTDKDGAAGTATYQYVVVYDPSAGFVTGGGWINSPEGACQLSADCQNATGKANFGFVSKYQKGANVPTGNTQFQFQAGNLDFHSTSYQWLVISGAKVQYKGAGTINGVSGYDFLLTATDGQVTGGGGTDMFRIKITDHVTGAVVYDNMLGDSDAQGNGQAIGGGSIVIHN